MIKLTPNAAAAVSISETNSDHHIPLTPKSFDIAYASGTVRTIPRSSVIITDSALCFTD